MYDGIYWRLCGVVDQSLEPTFDKVPLNTNVGAGALRALFLTSSGIFGHGLRPMYG